LGTGSLSVDVQEEDRPYYAAPQPFMKENMIYRLA